MWYRTRIRHDLFGAKELWLFGLYFFVSMRTETSDLIPSFYGARFALLADDIIHFRNVLGLHFSNAENSPKKLPQNDLFRSKSLKHTFFAYSRLARKGRVHFLGVIWSHMIS